MVDFLFVIIERFCHLLQLRRYKRKFVEVGIYRRGWSLDRKFQTEGASPPPTTVGVRKPVIAFLCGIKISAVHCLVLSQSMRVTNRQMDRQNYDCQDRAIA